MNNITNKRSWVARARRNAEEEPDLMLKFKLIGVLRNKFGIHARTGPKIAIHRKYGYVKQTLTKGEMSEFYPHDPDVTALRHNPPIIFEIDGDVHFFNARGIKRTNARNEHYDFAIINGKHPKLIWLTADEMRLSDEAIEVLLLQKFSQHGLKISSKAK
ncbi:hypothetical protein KAR91_03485 [Candidatus Pacearchaeota archaeon]|nr:hypothetical protein [Candidatus Pacearchaeota archaeon]